MAKAIKASKAAFSGKRGELRVQDILNSWNIICTPTGANDYGEDIICDIFTDSLAIRTNLTFRVQVKSTDDVEAKKYIRKTRSGYSVSLPVHLLDYWRKTFYPTLLVIWDCKTNTGHWCDPLQEFAPGPLPDQETVTVHVPKDAALSKSRKVVKERIANYYEGVFKIDSSLLKCWVFPVWMPEFNLMTAMEISEFMEGRKDILKGLSVEYGTDVAEHLPSFLTSLNSLDVSGYHSFLNFEERHCTIDKFLKNVHKALLTMQLGIPQQKNKWLSFIISPVEIVSRDIERTLSTLTEWTCVAVVDGNMRNEFNFVFDPGREYSFSAKLRATADDSCLYVHKSGRFAVEMTTTTILSHAMRKNAAVHESFLRRSYCVWDISPCSDDEIDGLEQWCGERQLAYQQIEGEEQTIIISLPHFSVGTYGILSPAVMRWNNLKDDDLSSDDFLREIPYGCRPAPERIKFIEEKFIGFKEGFGTETKVTPDTYIAGLPCNLLNRLIRFICYIKDDGRFRGQFMHLKPGYEKEISRFSDVLQAAKFDYEVYEDGVCDYVLTLWPQATVDSKDLICMMQPLYVDFLDQILAKNRDEHTMAYYVQYHLGRDLPIGFKNVR